MFIIQKFEKNGTWCCAPSHGKWNKIIKYVLSVKLWEEIGFLQDPRKTYIFYAICFLYVSQKRFRNKLCLEPHDTYVLFRTFFSHINIKQFFYHPIPLNGLETPRQAGCTVEVASIPIRVRQFSGDIKVYVISNFLPSSLILDCFFDIKLFEIKYPIGICILNLEYFNSKANYIR